MLKPFQNIQLVKFEASTHTSIIHGWYYSGEYPEYFWSYPEILGMDSIANEFVDKTLMIVELTSKTIVGMITMAVRSENSRNFETSILINNQFKGKGFGKRALKLALQYQFNTKNFYKCLSPVLDINRGIQNFVNKFGWKQEATLKKHGFYNGEFHDLFIFTIFKSDFNKMYKSDFESKAPRLEEVLPILPHEKARLEPDEKAANHGRIR